MVDPADSSAFVTGLTFVTNGSFTGTMTPITTIVSTVPEPSTGLIFAAACGALWLRRAPRRPVPMNR